MQIMGVLTITELNTTLQNMSEFLVIKNRESIVFLEIAVDALNKSSDRLDFIFFSILLSHSMHKFLDDCKL